MNKPIKPKKPSKNDKKPSEEILIEKWICVDTAGDLFLTPVSYNQYGYVEYYYDGLYEKSEIDFYDLERINKTLNHGYTLKAVTAEFYLDGWIVSWTEDNPNYESEMLEYEQRFDNYSINLKKYEDAVDFYNFSKKEQELEKLRAKLRRKEKELSK